MTRRRKTAAHGREDVTVSPGEEKRPADMPPTGRALIQVMQELPIAAIRIERVRTPGRVRDVDV